MSLDLDRARLEKQADRLSPSSGIVACGVAAIAIATTLPCFRLSIGTAVSTSAAKESGTLPHAARITTVRFVQQTVSARTGQSNSTENRASPNAGPRSSTPADGRTRWVHAD